MTSLRDCTALSSPAPMPGDTVYVPVRLSVPDGFEFMDVRCASEAHALMEAYIEDTRDTIPTWDRDNPVQRVELCRLIPVDDED